MKQLASKVDLQREKIERMERKAHIQREKLAKMQEEIKAEELILETMEKDQVGLFMKEYGMTGDEVVAFLRQLKENTGGEPTEKVDD